MPTSEQDAKFSWNTLEGVLIDGVPYEEFLASLRPEKDVPPSPLRDRDKTLLSWHVKEIIEKKDKLQRRICYEKETGKRVPCNRPEVAKIKPSRLKKPVLSAGRGRTAVNLEGAKQAIEKVRQEGASEDNLKKLASSLQAITVKEKQEILRSLQEKVSGRKQELIDRIKTKLSGGVKPPVEPQPEITPPTPEGNQPEPEKPPTPEKPPEPTKPTGPKPVPPSPGFTGEDTLGRKWENGEAKGGSDTDMIRLAYGENSVAVKIRESHETLAMVNEIASGLGLQDNELFDEETERRRIKDAIAETFDELTARRNALGRIPKTGTRNREKRAPLEKIVNELDRRIDELREERDSLTRRRKQAQTKARAAARKVLERRVTQPLQLNVADWGPNTDPNNEFGRAFTTGVQWLQGVVQRGSTHSDIKLRMVNEALSGGRASAYTTRDFNRADINWPNLTDSGVAVHEAVHLVEAHDPGLYRLTSDFRQYRISKSGTADIKMAERFPDHGYGASEVGNEDSFLDAFGGSENKASYTGKTHNRESATEILTMGTERFYNDPVAFARADPEYCALVVGVLTGTLRYQEPQAGGTQP